MSTLRDILEELVSLDSTSARSNLPVIDLLERHLAAIGFACRRLPYRDANGVEKANLVATLGPNPETPGLAVVGHTDTVPHDPAWHDALRLKSKEGRLVGRGACDNKGFIACALEAAAQLDRSNQSRALALVFTADEETGFGGAKELARLRPIAPRFWIVGEPTSLTPVRAHKGYSLAHVEIEGREGHSAYPGTGVSAILAAAEMVTRIEAMGRTLSREVHPDFEPAYTTLNVGRIEGGTAANVIPGRCRFTLEWRPVPGQAMQRVLDVVGAAARDVSASRGLRVSVAPERSDPPFEAPKDGELVRFFESRCGKSAVTVPFATEAGTLSALGGEAIVFGPGDIRQAHKTGESVAEDELERCRDLLKQAMETFCL